MTNTVTHNKFNRKHRFAPSTGRGLSLIGVLLTALLIGITATWAEKPAERIDLFGVDVPKGVAADTYIIYRDFHIPIRYYNDRHIPGHVKIIYADDEEGKDVLWVAKRKDIGRAMGKILPKELDRVLKVADRFFDTYRTDRALIEYERILSLMPKNPYLHLRIAQCYSMMHQEEKALEYLKNTLKMGSAKHNYQATNELAIIAFANGDLDNALKYFQKAQKQSRNSDVYKHNVAEVRLALADRYLAEGQSTQAQKQLELVMTQYPDYANDDLPPKEESVFRRHIEISRMIRLLKSMSEQTEETLWVDAGKKLIDGRRHSEAITLFRTLYEQSPENKDYKNYLISSFLSRGDELFASENWEEAVQNYQDAKQYISTEELLKQALVKALRQRGDKSYDKKEWGPAVTFYDRLYRIFPEDQDVKKLLAKSHFYQGSQYSQDYRYTEALDSAIAAVQTHNKARYRRFQADMHVELGLLEAAGHHWKEALAHFTDASKADSTHISARRLYMTTLLRKFFAEQLLIASLVTLVLLISLSVFINTWRRLHRSKKLSRLQKLGLKAFNSENWAEALDYFERYRQVAGRVANIEVFERMAECFTNLGEYNNAILNYNRAEELLGQEHRFSFEKAQIFAYKGNPELTIQFAKETEDPVASAQELLDFLRDRLNQTKDRRLKERYREVVGSIYLMKGDIDTAKSVFKDLQRDNRREKYALRKLIDIAKLEKNSDELKKYLETYLEIDATNASIIFELGEYYESTGRKLEAFDRYSEAYDITPVDRIRTRIIKLGRDFLDAMASGEAETVSVGVASLDTYKALSETLIRVNDHDTALELLQKLAASGISDPWVNRYMAECFDNQMIDDMAIKYYRRYLDQVRKDTETPQMTDDEKSVIYSLARAYERRGLAELAMKEFQSIYEQDIKYKDVSLKIPTLYEKKLREEKRITDESENIRSGQRQVARPQQNQIRCPRCLNIIANNVVHCPFCNCKVGYSETELEEQSARRQARHDDDGPEDPALMSYNERELDDAGAEDQTNDEPTDTQTRSD